MDGRLTNGQTRGSYYNIDTFLTDIEKTPSIKMVLRVLDIIHLFSYTLISFVYSSIQGFRFLSPTFNYRLVSVPTLVFSEIKSKFWSLKLLFKSSCAYSCAHQPLHLGFFPRDMRHMPNIQNARDNVGDYKHACPTHHSFQKVEDIFQRKMSPPQLHWTVLTALLFA